jgi:membrane-associated protein
VGLLLGAGYTLGGLEWVQRNFEKVVIGIVIVSVLPIVWEWWKARSTRRAAAADR